MNKTLGLKFKANRATKRNEKKKLKKKKMNSIKILFENEYVESLKPILTDVKMSKFHKKNLLNFLTEFIYD